MIIYVLSAVSGSTLIKYGSSSEVKSLFVLPIVHMNISLAALLGILTYGISFVTYVVLLSRFDLSFISPLLIAFVYILLMFTAFFIFHESFTLLKTLGCVFILVGILLVLSRQ